MNEKELANGSSDSSNYKTQRNFGYIMGILKRWDKQRQIDYD